MGCFCVSTHLSLILLLDLFIAPEKFEHEMQSSALTLFLVLETILKRSTTALSTLNRCSSRLDYPYECDFSSSYISMDFEHVYEPMKCFW